MSRSRSWRWWAGDWFGGWDPDESTWQAPRRGFFRSGEVRLALLSLLSGGPAHGYDLMKQLEQRSGRVYHASAGTVYPVLQQLEDEGLIAVKTENGKKVYALTAAGQQEVGKHADEIDAIWRRAERWHEWGTHITPDTAALAALLGRLTKTAFRAVVRQPELADRVREIFVEAEDKIRSAAEGGRGGGES